MSGYMYMNIAIASKNNFKEETELLEFCAVLRMRARKLRGALA